MCLRDFNNYVDHYLCVRKLEIEETTLRGYQNLSRYFKKYFEGKKLLDIKKIDIECYFKYLSEYEYKEGKTLSTNTIVKHYDLLKMIFAAAIDDELIEKNPFVKIGKPKKQEFLCEIYSTQEVKILLQEIKKNKKLEIPIILAVFLGLRRGEICGLKWKHIDFANNCISIRETRTVAGGRVIRKSVKSKKSIRKMYLSLFLKNLLLTELQNQKQLYPDKNFNEEYICIDEKGKALRPGYISDGFKNILKKTNLKKIRLHDLRHTCASIANNNKATLNDISNFLGHSSVTITSQIYIHLFQNTFEKVITDVEQSILN